MQTCASYSRTTAGASSTGGATQDLDYFVQMLAGTSEPKQVEQITRKATEAVAPRKARPGDNTPPAPVAAAKFINAEHVLSGHSGFVFDTAVHVATSRLFTASADNTIGVWDLSTMKLINTLRGHTNNVYW